MSRKSLYFGISYLSLIIAGIQPGTQAQAAETAKDDIETISVYAQGITRQVQSIDQQSLLDAAPGTSPIKVIAELPGVNYTSADSFGAYEWATRISVRGFNQNQLGFTLDDVPLGDMSYGNWNGLHISRAIINENIGKTVISQGTGALGTASNSNLGGTMQFYSADPSDKFQVSAAQSFGSDSAFRTYASLDSGLLPSQTKFNISVANQAVDKWKGVGQDRALQFNSKLVQTLGDNTLTAFANYSDRAEVDYQDLSKEMVSKLGYNWDNYKSWHDAVQAGYGTQAFYAGLPYASFFTHGEANTSDAPDDAYYGGAGLRKDLLGGITLLSPINSALTLKNTVYGHHDDGRGLWYTPYVPSPDGTPVSMRTSEYTQGRFGYEGSASYEIGRNTIQGGLWYEKEYFNLARRYYAASLASPMHSLYDFPSDPFRTDWAFHFNTDVVQGFVEDSFKITDRITVNAGFKGTQTSISGRLVQGGGYASGDIDSSEPFLPQAGISWKVTDNDELFADVAKNMRSFQAGGPGYGASPFQMTQSQFDANKNALKPETSWTEEVGYRLKHGPVNGEVVGYHVNFADRLLGISQCAGIVGCANALANVGGVTSNGVEVAATWHVLPGITWYNGASYNSSTYDADVVSGGVRYNTKDKTAVDTPDFMYKTDIGYDYEGFYSHLVGDYMSRRYYTYTNDNSVGGRMIWDLSVGYMLDTLGGMRDVRVQFNVTNLFDKKYYASIGTNGFSMTDPNGTSQTLQVGAPRAFFGTISAKF